jgi:hypothetical protein
MLASPMVVYKLLRSYTAITWRFSYASVVSFLSNVILGDCLPTFAWRFPPNVTIEKDFHKTHVDDTQYAVRRLSDFRVQSTIRADS